MGLFALLALIREAITVVKAIFFLIRNVKTVAGIHHMILKPGAPNPFLPQYPSPESEPDPPAQPSPDFVKPDADLQAADAQEKKTASDLDRDLTDLNRKFGFDPKNPTTSGSPAAQYSTPPEV